MKTPRPRLEVPGAPPLGSTARALQEIASWAKSFKGRWPGEANRPVTHWHLPADQRMVDPPGAQRPDQIRGAKALLDAAAHLRDARGRDRDAEVYAAIFWPEMFMSEVGIFHDKAYAASFADRTSPFETWTQFDPSVRSLAKELDLSPPDGFSEHGYQIIRRDDETTYSGEVWLYRG